MYIPPKTLNLGKLAQPKTKTNQNSNPLQWEKWFETYPKLEWKSKFDFLLSKESRKTAESSDFGIHCFVKGLHAEYIHEDFQLAFDWYEKGAAQFEPLCLFKLHEIYIGDPQFKVAYDEKQVLAHLVYSTLLSVYNDEKAFVWKKFESFWNSEISKTTAFQEVLRNPPAYYFTSTGPLFSKLFTFYTNKKIIIDILPEVKSLSFDAMKTRFYYILNLLLDFQGYMYNANLPISEILQSTNEIADLFTNDILFNNFFNNFLSHLKLLQADKKTAQVFQLRLDSEFWVWSFTFLVSSKNHYLEVLLQYQDVFLDESLSKPLVTLSWINNFASLCFEKGIGAPGNPEKALEFYEKDIKKTPRVLFSRLRRLIILKTSRSQQPEQSGEGLAGDEEEFRELLAERFMDKQRMDCYLFYLSGKLAERFDDDIDKAIECYENGVKVSTDFCLRHHLLHNESFRMKCWKRLQKLQKKKGLDVVVFNKNQED